MNRKRNEKHERKKQKIENKICNDYPQLMDQKQTENTVKPL